MDYDTKKWILRVLTIGCGLFAIWPTELSPILNFRIIDAIPFLVPRTVLGAAAIIFAIGSWKRWW